MERLKMNILRGALTCLIVVAIFAVVECKRTENENVAPPAVTTQVESSTTGTGLMAKTITCFDASPNDTLCNGNPCTVTVDLSSTSTRPQKVWVSDTQEVKWVGTGDPDTKLTKLHFAKKADGSGAQWKKGDRKLHEADCRTGDCIKANMMDANPCVAYGYTILAHNKKVIDPDVEVGSTTGTTTSGTAGVH